jgi:hypothetical protein
VLGQGQADTPEQQRCPEQGLGPGQCPRQRKSVFVCVRVRVRVLVVIATSPPGANASHLKQHQFQHSSSMPERHKTKA